MAEVGQCRLMHCLKLCEVSANVELAYGTVRLALPSCFLMYFPFRHHRPTRILYPIESTSWHAFIKTVVSLTFALS